MADPFKTNGAKVGCCGLFKKKEQPFDQTIVVLRHSERLDHVDPNYRQTPEGKDWPFDTPLTEQGVELAKTVAADLEALHKKANFAMIACSPYRRCMETATQVAKRLRLPVIIDQEIGEVWDEEMPNERPPHRSPIQLQMMAKELGIQVNNPLLPEGGFKLFGKPPVKWPETIRNGHERCIVRVNFYVEQSAITRQNFIIVSHAPAVAAMMSMFQRGMCDVEKLDYCARVIASRSCLPSKVAEDSDKDRAVYIDEWQVNSEGVAAGLNFEATEEDHLKDCEETSEQVTQRKERRTRTDKMWEDQMKQVRMRMPEEHPETIREEEEEAAVAY